MGIEPMTSSPAWYLLNHWAKEVLLVGVLDWAVWDSLSVGFCGTRWLYSGVCWPSLWGLVHLHGQVLWFMIVSIRKRSFVLCVSRCHDFSSCMVPLIDRRKSQTLMIQFLGQNFSTCSKGYVKSGREDPITSWRFSMIMCRSHPISSFFGFVQETAEPVQYPAQSMCL